MFRSVAVAVFQVREGGQTVETHTLGNVIGSVHAKEQVFAQLSYFAGACRIADSHVVGLGGTIAGSDPNLAV